MAPKSLDDVFASPYLPLSRIVFEIEQLGARAVVSILLKEVVSFFNVGKTMNDTQVAMTCDIIIDNYPEYRLEDFKLCFRNAMALKYGKLFDRLDGGIIMEWLSRYAKERNEYVSLSAESSVNEMENIINDGVFYQDYLLNLQNRVSNGDEEAKGYLDRHLAIQSFLKQPEYARYKKDREYLRLHGKGETRR